MLNAARSPLLRLPPELRIQIWEFVFREAVEICVRANKYSSRLAGGIKLRYRCTRKHVETAQPVSKQVWAESPCVHDKLHLQFPPCTHFPGIRPVSSASGTQHSQD